jgi:hypothetical protein
LGRAGCAGRDLRCRWGQIAVDPTRGHFDDHRSFFFRNTVEDAYAVMVENGDGAKPV